MVFCAVCCLFCSLLLYPWRSDNQSNNSNDNNKNRSENRNGNNSNDGNKTDSSSPAGGEDTNGGGQPNHYLNQVMNQKLHRQMKQVVVQMVNNHRII